MAFTLLDHVWENMHSSKCLEKTFSILIIRSDSATSLKRGSAYGKTMSSPPPAMCWFLSISSRIPLSISSMKSPPDSLIEVISSFYIYIYII